MNKEENLSEKRKEPIRRGDIYWVRFGKTVGTEIRDPHPAVIISNNWQNEKGSRVVVLPMSSKVDKIYPFDLYVGKVIANANNYKESKIMCEQIKSVSKKRLSEKRIGVLPPELLAKAEIKVKKVLAFEDKIRYFLLWKK
jgi:mRNA interferase MazF